MAWDKNAYYREYYRTHPEYQEYQRQYHKKWFAEHPNYTREYYRKRVKERLKGAEHGQTEA